MSIVLEVSQISDNVAYSAQKKAYLLFVKNLKNKT